MQNSHSDHQMMAMQSNGMKIAGYIEEFTKTSSTQIFQPITKQSFIAIRKKRESHKRTNWCYCKRRNVIGKSCHTIAEWIFLCYERIRNSMKFLSLEIWMEIIFAHKNEQPFVDLNSQMMIIIGWSCASTSMCLFHIERMCVCVYVVGKAQWWQQMENK